MHWVVDVITGGWDRLQPLPTLGLVVLIIGWAIFLRATSRSLGIAGLVLAIAFFALLIWLLVTWFPFLLNNNAMMYILLIALSCILGIGMSWSHIRRRMTGQLDVDDIDE